jgi:hypothetical protein
VCRASSGRNWDPRPYSSASMESKVRGEVWKARGATAAGKAIDRVYGDEEARGGSQYLQRGDDPEDGGMSRRAFITKLLMPKFKRIEGNWRCTSDRRIYEIQAGHPEDDRYIGTATSIDDAISLCNEHNKAGKSS